MRHRIFIAVVCAVLLIGAYITPIAAQDDATATPEYDPSCAVNLMKAYMSGWEYDRRSSTGVIDVVAAAQVARGVYKVFDAAKVTCEDTLGDFKQILLESMHGDYPPEDLARMLAFVDEALGQVDYNDCSYSVGLQFVRQVEWGDTSAIEVGRAVSKIFRTVRNVIPSGNCDGTFQIIQEITSRIEKVPPDGSLISTLYKVVGDATQGHYVNADSCDYTLAKTFLDKVRWDGLDSTHIVNLVSDTFKITYKISGDVSCNSDPALAITAMLLDDTYHFAPDANVLQQTYDAATGQLIATPEATAPPIVN